MDVLLSVIIPAYNCEEFVQEGIALNEDKDTAELITDNYGLLSKVAKSVEYHYLLNMNYTIFHF